VKTILILAAFGASTALAIQGRHWLAQYPTTVLSVEPAQAQQTGLALEAEIITITPRGFEPAEITRPKGAFILLVDNRSELDEITFRLDHEAGHRQHEVRVTREQWDWDGMVNLHPGIYMLTEASHPDWLCRITITAQ
jgi:hypothetical protein